MKKYILIAIPVLFFIEAGFCTLMIKEVGFGGTDERIGIENNWFTGNISLQWAKSSSIELEITTFDDIIIGDHEENSYWFSWSYFGKQWLSLVDSKEISLQLYSSEILIDEVSFSQEEVTERKKESNSFIIGESNTLVEENNENPLEQEEFEEATPKLSPWSIEIIAIKPHDTDQGKEYIELQAHQAINWTVQIDWLGQSDSPKSIEINIWTGDIVRISDGDYDEEGSIQLPSISLTDSWETLQILWQSWQVIDIVVYESSSRGSELEFISLLWNQRFFGEKNIWIHTNFLPSHGCSIIIQNSRAIYAWESLNLMAGNKGKQLRNGSSIYHCEREWVKHSESTKCNPSSFILEEEWIHTLRLKVFERESVCETAISINLPKKTLYENGDQKVCEINTNTSINQEESEIPSVLVFSWSSYEFSERSAVQLWILSITWILPNPLGSDTEKESFILKNEDNQNFDTTWLIVQSDKRKYPIESKVLWVWEEIQFVGEYGFYNRASCVQLLDSSWTLYDSICYPEAKNDQWYERKNSSTKNTIVESILEEVACVSPKNEESNKNQELDSVVNNVKKAETLDWTPKEEDEKPEKNTYSWVVYSWATLASKQEKEIEHQPWSLIISAILPNPEWSDTWNESLVVKYIWTWENTIDMSWLIVNSGKRSKALKNSTKKGDTGFIRTGDLWLYNTPRCILLESNKWVIYDEFCYPKAETGAWYSKSISVEAIHNDDWYSAITLDISDETVCVMIQDQEVTCKANPKLSVEKKLLKEQEKRVSDQNTYEQKLLTTKDKLSLEEEKNNLHEEFIYSSMGDLQQDRYTVAQNSGLLDQYNNRKEQKSISEENPVLSNFNLIEQFYISNHEYPMDTSEIEISIDQIVTTVPKKRETLKSNLQK